MRGSCPNCDHNLSNDFIANIIGKRDAKPCPSCGSNVYISWWWGFVEFSGMYIFFYICLAIFLIITAASNVWLGGVVSISCLYLLTLIARYFVRFAKVKEYHYSSSIYLFWSKSILVCLLFAMTLAFLLYQLTDFFCYKFF